MAEAYTNSAHQSVIGTVNTEKKVSVAMMVRHVLFYPSSNPPFAKLFSPFSNLISHRKGIYFQ